MIVRRVLPIQLIGGSSAKLLFYGLEYQTPYTLCLVLTDGQSYTRVDVAKSDLAHELRNYMNGKRIFFPAFIVSPRLENQIADFVKFGKTPVQSTLLLWLLSRCEML